jgi:hypothetical protein
MNLGKRPTHGYRHFLGLAKQRLGLHQFSEIGESPDHGAIVQYYFFDQNRTPIVMAENRLAGRVTMQREAPDEEFLGPVFGFRIVSDLDTKS